MRNSPDLVHNTLFNDVAYLTVAYHSEGEEQNIFAHEMRATLKFSGTDGLTNDDDDDGPGLQS